MVTGGRSREAAALAWERQGPAPDKTSYKNWAKSVLDNPAVVESTVNSNSSAHDLSQVRNQNVHTLCLCVLSPGATNHTPGEGDPMCCHKEAPPEDGPATVPG